MQTYGDLFSPKTLVSHEGAVASSSAIPRIQLANNNRWVDLIYIPADVLADEYPLTVIEYLPDGDLAPRLYTQRELEQVAELEAGDQGLLNFGLKWEKRADQPSGEPAMTEATEEKKPDGNSLQTELEFKLATDPKLIEAVKSEFTKISLKPCSKDFRPEAIPIGPMPLTDGRQVPVGVMTTSCSLGFVVESTFFFPVKITDPPLEFNGVRTFCKTPFKFEDTRNFLFKEVQKSTKVNFQLGVNIAKLPGLPPGLSPSPDGSFIPKVGDPAFKDNQRLQQPDANGKLVGVDFDFSMVRQYVKVTVNEFRRVLFDAPGKQCFDL